MKAHVISMFLVLAAMSCARPGTPTGGKKDEKPPRVTESVPDNYTTRFKEKIIEITFDEFIQLKDVNSQLLVSPPMKKAPRVINKGKVISIELADTLRENTTYTLNFGKSITDNNEGNALLNYEFVFSTGSVIDSFGIEGTVLQAFDLKPTKDPVFVLVYDDLSDSAFVRQKPLYLGRTNAEGKFRINNLRPDTFKVYALGDANSNLFYDSDEEMAGFADSVVWLSADNFSHLTASTADTTPATDSLLTLTLADSVADTLPSDTASLADSLDLKRKVYLAPTNLFLYNQHTYRQYLENFTRDLPDHLLFDFSEPVTDSISLTLPGYEPFANQIIREIHPGNDSVHIWFADSFLVRIDTCTLLANYFYTDSTGQYTLKQDTLRMRKAESAAKTESARPKREKEQEAKKLPSLVIAPASRTFSTLDLNQVVSLTAQRPISHYDLQYIVVSRKADSLYVPIDYKVEQEKDYIRNFIVHFTLEENTKYRIELLPGAFTDFLGNTNDTTQYETTTRELAYYGKLLLNLKGLNIQAAIVQLLDDKENVVRELYTNSDGQLVYDYLQPRKYKLKIIFDTNANQVWDSGLTLQRIQPEKVMYYKEEVNIRSNWDLETDWVLTP